MRVQITIVDGHTFIKEYADRNPCATRPDLGGDDSSFRPVVDLLVEQVEVADYVVLNKVDLLGVDRVPELEEIVKTINPLCTVQSCAHGDLDMDALFGPKATELMASLNTEGQHRGYVAKAREAEGGHKRHRSGGHDHGHKHDYDHDHDHNGTDHKHDHGHAHAHKHDHGHGDHGHGHDHGHDHKGSGHKHDHGHGHHHGHDHHGHDHHDHAHGDADGEHHSIDRTTAETRCAPLLAQPICQPTHTRC